MSDGCNIAYALEGLARTQAETLAVVMPKGRDASGKRTYETLTYAQLDARSTQYAKALVAYGIAPGTRTALMVRPSPDFFALTFGLLKAGIVPVMIDPGLGRTQLKACLAEAAPEAFIGIPVAHAARIALGWARGSVKRLVTVGRRWFWGGTTTEALLKVDTSTVILPPTRADDVAAILFTSGSTGIAKGVVYEHGHFVAQVEMIRASCGIGPGETDLPTFPMFALFDPALGMTTIIPEMDFTRPARVDPAMLAELVDDWQVTNVFGSPALLTTVAREAKASGRKWKTVRRVLSAGAPVPVATLEGMRAVLPEGAPVLTPYGATECLPVANIRSDEILSETRHLTDAGHGVCVGRIAPPNDVRIIAITDAPIADWSEVRELPPGEVGEITVLGPTTTKAYFSRESATRAAKVQRSGRTVHRMGDVGYFDAQGRLWYCGRKSHRVELEGRTLFTAPVEELLNTHPAVFRTALVGVVRGGEKRAVICVEREPAATISDDALFDELRALASRHEVTRGLDTFLVHPGFPVDIRHNAKIGRETLALWAQGKLK